MSIFDSSRLANKTVLITGASSGIGAATAILFAKAGSNLVLLARRTDALKDVENACADARRQFGTKEGGKVAILQADVSDKAQVASIIDRIPEDLRTIDVLVNNAGYVIGVDRIGDIDGSVVDGMFATNVLGLIAVTQLIVKGMQARNSGHIINIGSVAGREPYIGGGIYCATKHAVRAFTGVLLRELVNTKIRVTEVQPGMVETEFSIVRFQGDKTKADKVYEGLQPLTPTDIAEEIAWTASRPPHINIAESFVLPTNQATPWLSYRGN